MSQDIFAPSTVLGGTGDVLGVEFGDDSAIAVTFYMREVEDEEQTRIQGRVIKKNVEFCRMEFPGDNRSNWDQPVRERDKHRFPQQYAAFKQGEGEMVIGTPLESWPLLTADHRIALKNLGFKTVEQVANVSDAAIGGMVHGNGPLLQNLREHAKKWLETQEAGAAERRLAEEVAKKDRELDVLRDQMRSMAQQLEAVHLNQMAGAQVDVPAEPQPAPEPIPDVNALADIPTVEPVEPPKRRGRPPKEKAE